VTLVWTDRPAAAASCQRTTMSVLTNDLDLRIVGPDQKTVYPQATQGRGPDRFNPVEQISISSPVAGGNYTIQVEAYGLVTSQPYSLVITGQFSGFRYNETLGSDTRQDLWTMLADLAKNKAPALVLIILAIVISLWMCLCCLRFRSKRPEEVAREAALQQQQGQGQARRGVPDDGRAFGQVDAGVPPPRKPPRQQQERRRGDPDGPMARIGV
jgi:hypothetical protein